MAGTGPAVDTTNGLGSIADARLQGAAADYGPCRVLFQPIRQRDRHGRASSPVQRPLCYARRGATFARIMSQIQWRQAVLGLPSPVTGAETCLPQAKGE